MTVFMFIHALSCQYECPKTDGAYDELKTGMVMILLHMQSSHACLPEIQLKIKATNMWSYRLALGSRLNSNSSEQQS